jgi:uncharacterized protein (TIGR02466 family)
MNHIQKIFSNTLFASHSLLPKKDLKLMVDECKKIQQHAKQGGDNWSCNTYNTLGTYELKDNIKFKKLIDVVTEKVNIYAKELQSDYNYECGNSWFNIYKKGDYQEYHYHSDSYFSAIFILKTPNPPPLIVFENPFLDMLPLKNLKKNNENNAGTYKVADMNENCLLIFRSYLRHMVQPLQQDEERISIAFNF